MSGKKSFRAWCLWALLLGVVACGKDDKTPERVPGIIGEEAASFDTANHILACEVRAELGTSIRYTLSGNELTLKRGTRTSTLTRAKGSKATDIYDTWVIPQSRVQDDPALTVDAVLTIRPNEVDVASHCESSSLAADVKLTSRVEVTATEITLLESKVIRKTVSH